MVLKLTEFTLAVLPMSFNGITPIRGSFLIFQACPDRANQKSLSGQREASWILNLHV